MLKIRLAWHNQIHFEKREISPVCCHKDRHVLRTTSLTTMQMSFVRAVISLYLCQLIAGLQLEVCESIRDDTNRCMFTSPPYTSRVGVKCNDWLLTINVTNVHSGNPFNKSNTDHFPSLYDMWHSCNHGQRWLDGPIYLTDVDLMYINIPEFPDNYFCNFTSIETIWISGNSLHDTRKLGFSPTDSCETPCATKVDRLYAVNNTFETLPDTSFCGLTSLIYLDLRKCRIKEVHSDAFTRLRSLQTLDLGYNRISTLPLGIFREQENTLQHLYLFNNQLDGKSTLHLKNLKNLNYLDLTWNRIDVIPAGVFNEMSKLTYLSIGHNVITTLQGVLTGLSNMETLLIDNNNISIIKSEDFRYMVNLVEIDFDDNQITTIEPDALTNCVNLTRIRFSNTSLSTVPQCISELGNVTRLLMSHNNISQIKTGAFDASADIDSIDLSYNQLTDITNVFTNCSVKYLILDYNILTELSFTDFSFKLYHLSITHNHIHKINTGFGLINDVATVQNWTLKTLNVSYNHLTELDDLSLPRSVSVFDAHNNQISVISYTKSYEKILNSERKGRTEIHLENNAFYAICPSFIYPLRQSLTFYFTGNPLRCSCKSSWLSSEYYFKRYLPSSNIDQLSNLTCQHEFQRLGSTQSMIIQRFDDRDYLCGAETSCYCKNKDNYACHLKCPKPCQCYSNANTSLIHMDCSSKNITDLSFTHTINFDHARELYVYLDNNSINQINSSSLMGLNSTIELYLNWSNVNEIEDGSFDHLTKLKILHLDHNNLRHILDNIFDRLLNLTHLFLSHNQLQTVAPNAFPSQLQTLFMDNNQIVNYSVWQLDNFTHINKLSLHGNKWSCECDYVEKFRNFLQKHSDKVEDTEKLFCIQSNGTKPELPLITFNSSFCYNTTSINIQMSYFADIWKAVLGVVAFLAIASVLIYLFRREVQVLIYSRLGVRLFYDQVKDETKGKLFDAFIAYSCVDEDFLVQRLLPGLEHIDDPYILCLHHRNFMGGASIINSIMEAVQFSTRTIILLSDNFMRSEWCRFEFQQAYIQMLKDRCNRLLVIVIDEVPTNIDPEMNAYLRTNTYLKWGDRLFWKKLHFAMPERLQLRSNQEFPMQAME